MPEFSREHKPTSMPGYYFPDGTRFDFASAIRADTSRQDFSVEPRHWYVDATSRCERCNQDFTFSAEEQRFWYEELRFYVDSFARKCPACRGELRNLKMLRQQYDQQIAEAVQSNDIGLKQQLVSIIDAMGEVGPHMPDRIQASHRLLQGQIKRLGGAGAEM